MKRFNFYRVFLFAVVFLSVLALLIQNFFGPSGKAIFSTPSKVALEKYISIEFSENLSEGILFGDVQFLPAVDVNASHNYDGSLNGSTLYVTVSSDSSTDVDFCIRGSGDLINEGGDHLGLGNETYSYNNVTNMTLPDLSSDVALTTSYVLSGENFGPGEVNYWRFWLDVPTGMPTGDYNNTVTIKAIAVDDSC